MTTEVRVKVEFNEQSKAVVASVSYEEIGAEANTDRALAMAKKMFDDAQGYALLRTMKRSQ